jgi:hypothetical protein
MAATADVSARKSGGCNSVVKTMDQNERSVSWLLSSVVIPRLFKMNDIRHSMLRVIEPSVDDEEPDQQVLVVSPSLFSHTRPQVRESAMSLFMLGEVMCCTRRAIMVGVGSICNLHGVCIISIQRMICRIMCEGATRMAVALAMKYPATLYTSTPYTYPLAGDRYGIWSALLQYAEKTKRNEDVDACMPTLRVIGGPGDDQSKNEEFIKDLVQNFKPRTVCLALESMKDIVKRMDMLDIRALCLRVSKRRETALAAITMKLAELLRKRFPIRCVYEELARCVKPGMGLKSKKAKLLVLSERASITHTETLDWLDFRSNTNDLDLYAWILETAHITDRDIFDNSEFDCEPMMDMMQNSSPAMCSWFEEHIGKCSSILERVPPDVKHMNPENERLCICLKIVANKSKIFDSTVVIDKCRRRYKKLAGEYPVDDTSSKEECEGETSRTGIYTKAMEEKFCPSKRVKR